MEMYAVSKKGKHLFSITMGVIPRVGELIECVESGKVYAVAGVHYQLQKLPPSVTRNVWLIYPYYNYVLSTVTTNKTDIYTIVFVFKVAAARLCDLGCTSLASNDISGTCTT